MKQRYSTLLSFTLAIMISGCGGGGDSTSTVPLGQSSISGSSNGSSSQTHLQSNSEGKISTISTKDSANDIAMGKNTLFISEGQSGVEIIQIGYNDKISTEVLSTIKDIDAQSVVLASDDKTLYIEDKTGYMQVYDVSDLTHPVRTGKTTKQKINNATVSQNGTYKYVPKGENGLDVYDISNPSNIEKVSSYTISNAYDIILVEDQHKALISTGAVGINLLDISNPKQLSTIGNYRIKGSKIMGLSLDKEDGILYVATGDKGVYVFDMDILLHKLEK